jgi:hypothetical protein
LLYRQSYAKIGSTATPAIAGISGIAPNQQLSQHFGMKWIPAFLCALSLNTQAEKATDFIRVDEDEKATRLQTGITTYQKDDLSVSLIGAVHIADKAYFEKLNAHFKKQDKLLFEMIGGENMTKIQKDAAKDEVVDTSTMAKTYAMVAHFLNLSEQKKEIDYTAKNFVHADFTLKEFEKLQEERGETTLSFAMKAAEGAEEQAQLSPEKLLQTLLSGNSNAAKLEVVHSLDKGDEQMGALDGQSVIINDRNKKCFNVLDQEIERGSKQIGIFYGAAHFPDIEKTLLSRGFIKQSHQWLTAWDIPKN